MFLNATVGLPPCFGRSNLGANRLFDPEITQHRKMVGIEVTIDPMAKDGCFVGFYPVVGENIIDPCPSFSIDVKGSERGRWSQGRNFRSGVGVVESSGHFLDGFRLRG